MIRLAIVALAIVGLVSLFSGGVAGAATGAGFLLLLPLLVLAKIVLFVVLLGFIARGCGWRRPYRPGPPWVWRERRDEERPDKPSREDEFAEWHRMAHAREEVDGWLPDVD